MKHKSPKQSRKKKRNPYILDGLPIQFTVIDIGGESRADRLPPYDEYNPNRIHVARRRRAHKDHHTFPRGWTWAPMDEGHITGSGFAVDSDTTAALLYGGWKIS